MQLRTFIAAAILAICQPAWADFSGELIRVIDGDTVEVVTQNHPITPGKMVLVRIRLADIDAPEKGQAFGERSRQTLAHLAFRQQVRVVEKELDRYGRTLGVIYSTTCTPVDTGKRPVSSCVENNINAEMVRTGMAWAYRYKGQATDGAMLKYETNARQAKRGLWSDPHAEEPWKWRRSKK